MLIWNFPKNFKSPYKKSDHTWQILLFSSAKQHDFTDEIFQIEFEIIRFNNFGLETLKSANLNLKQLEALLS